MWRAPDEQRQPEREVTDFRNHGGVPCGESQATRVSGGSGHDAGLARPSLAWAFCARLSAFGGLGRHVVLVVLGQHLAGAEDAVGLELALRHHTFAFLEQVGKDAAYSSTGTVLAVSVTAKRTVTPSGWRLTLPSSTSPPRRKVRSWPAPSARRTSASAVEEHQVAVEGVEHQRGHGRTAQRPQRQWHHALVARFHLFTPRRRRSAAPVAHVLQRMPRRWASDQHSQTQHARRSCRTSPRRYRGRSRPWPRSRTRRPVHHCPLLDCQRATHPVGVLLALEHDDGAHAHEDHRAME